jgi:hypothetical protein
MSSATQKDKITFLRKKTSIACEQLLRLPSGDPNSELSIIKSSVRIEMEVADSDNKQLTDQKIANKYIKQNILRSRAWAGQVEQIALSRALGINITTLSPDLEKQVISPHPVSALANLSEGAPTMLLKYNGHNHYEGITLKENATPKSVMESIEKDKYDLLAAQSAEKTKKSRANDKVEVTAAIEKSNRKIQQEKQIMTAKNSPVSEIGTVVKDAQVRENLNSLQQLPRYYLNKKISTVKRSLEEIISSQTKQIDSMLQQQRNTNQEVMLGDLLDAKEETQKFLDAVNNSPACKQEDITLQAAINSSIPKKILDTAILDKIVTNEIARNNNQGKLDAISEELNNIPNQVPEFADEGIDLLAEYIISISKQPNPQRNKQQPIILPEMRQEYVTKLINAIAQKANQSLSRNMQVRVKMLGISSDSINITADINKAITDKTKAKQGTPKRKKPWRP